MRCPNCGREVTPSAAICGYCGVMLPRSNPQQRSRRAARPYGSAYTRVPSAYFSPDELYENYTMTQTGAYYGSEPTQMRQPRQPVKNTQGTDSSRILQEIIIVLLALHVVLDLLLIIQGIFA